MREAEVVEAAEQHLIYVLLDSNLPTGGFVSSSGLESWAKHGFLSCGPYYPSSSSELNSGEGENVGKGKGKGKRNASEGIVEFTSAELLNYSKTTSCFVRDSWRHVWNHLNCNFTLGDVDVNRNEDEDGMREMIRRLVGIDKNHECSLLSHVGRRSSKAQGVAMLTLYVKGLAPTLTSQSVESISTDEEGEVKRRERMAMEIVNEYKRLIRKGEAPGHLAVCWGIMSACLGLKLDRAIHLHLFLHARSLLSSAVRLNLIGPYASTGLLLHPFRGIIRDVVDQLNYNTNPSSDSYTQKGEGANSTGDSSVNFQADTSEWQWADDLELELESGNCDDGGPETTWPLGELLMARHDLQHSRIFNS